MRRRREREDKSVLTEPRCPFCRQPFRKPEDIPTELGFFLGGVCECGAVYACDPTGRNLGEAFADALPYACNQDWDLAWSLTPGEDYEQMVLNYDLRTHRISPRQGPAYYRASKGKILFVKLREGIL
jgi:hypothetical protein